jgi:hypothetical protein
LLDVQLVEVYAGDGDGDGRLRVMEQRREEKKMDWRRVKRKGVVFR